MVRKLAMRRFRITEEQYNYWLGEWRFERK